MTYDLGRACGIYTVVSEAILNHEVVKPSSLLVKSLCKEHASSDNLPR